MKLDLSGIEIHNWAYDIMGGMSWRVLSAEDVEWDKDRGFLGFTITAQSNYMGSELQGRYRINFLKFNHNPNFKATPFADSNYEYMNILHVMGQKLNGTHQILQAAHWDLSKTHEIHLVNFPPEYESIGRQVVSDWNDALREVGALKPDQKGFVISDRKLKHSFDLRYTSIVWIADERAAESAPLGIAMAHADVRNGEILWGGITLWGGYLEAYIKSYSPSSGTGTLTSTARSIYGTLAGMFSSKFMPKEIGVPTSLKEMNYTNNLSLQNLKNFGIIPSAKLTPAEQKAAEEQAKKNPEAVNLKPEIKAMLADTAAKATMEWVRKQGHPLSYEQIHEMIFPGISEKVREADETLSKTYPKIPTAEQLKKALKNKVGGNISDLDRTFAEIGGELATAHRLSGKSFEQTMRIIVQGVTTHEYGHMLGLGHQFKENILPKPGSVPEKYAAELAKHATEAEGFTNATSVMGYRSPITEIQMKEAEKPGYQDKLVLHYLYNQEYATFKTGDQDFVFKKVPANGVLPAFDEQDKDRKTTYFEQCNDAEASMGLDPYCNRFDRGHNAVEIIKSYFDNIDTNLVQNLHAFTDSRHSRPEDVEGRLWWKGFDNLGRVRFFYDYMRQKYAKQIESIAYDDAALFEFSPACQKDEINETTVASPALREMFTKYPELKELCRANAYALQKMKDLVSINGTDFTKKILDRRYIPGGIRAGEADGDYSRFDGAWTEMTAVPLKMTALYALTSPIPWVNSGGWNMPIWTFNDPNLKFSYASLYPQEYTEIMAANVSANLKFSSISTDQKTVIGQSVLSMMFFNYLAGLNNDDMRFSKRYMDRIRNQTSYAIKVVAVILEGTANTKKNDPNRVVRFKGSIFDFSANKSTSVNDIYLLPNAEVLVRAKDMFLLPITPVQLYADKEGYAIAIQLNYYREYDDNLERLSAKASLRSLYDRVVDACIKGNDGNGLSSYFNTDAFEGFLMPEGTATDDEKYRKFLESINLAFESYYKNKNTSKEACRDVMKGISLVGTSASLLSGFWIGQPGLVQQ
jgi:hypothetical protein